MRVPSRLRQLTTSLAPSVQPASWSPSRVKGRPGSPALARNTSGECSASPAT